MGDRRVRSGPTSEQTDRVKPGENEHIDQGEAFEKERVGECADDVQHEPEKKVDGQYAGECQAEDKKSSRCDEADGRRKVSGGERAGAVASAASIGFDVEEIVDEVRGGS